MRAVHLIPYMHPTAGGPPVVADRFCRHLASLGCDCEIITSNSYARATDLSWVASYQAPYKMTVLDSVGPDGFGYARRLRKTLQRRLASTDIVHIHNLWSHFNVVGSSVCRQLRIPYVVSTHGMLDPNSISRKAWKKKLYGRFVEFPKLRSAAGMIYTHPDEQRLAESQCSGLPQGHIVPLAADAPPDSREKLAADFDTQFPQFANSVKLLFLGRLHSKKGLDLLIPAMKLIKSQIPNAELILVGPGDTSYLKSLKKMVAENGVEESTHFLGSLNGREKWSALAAADLFLLPSYQENFAIALVEALRSGLPAVISRRINIWREVSESGAGYVTDLDSDSVAETVTAALKDAQRISQASGDAERFAASSFSWDKSAKTLSLAYQTCIHQSKVGGVTSSTSTSI